MLTCRICCKPYAPHRPTCRDDGRCFACATIVKRRCEACARVFELRASQVRSGKRFCSDRCQRLRERTTTMPVRHCGAHPPVARLREAIAERHRGR